MTTSKFVFRRTESAFSSVPSPRIKLINLCYNLLIGYVQTTSFRSRQLSAQITGFVNRDYNGNGAKQSVEPVLRRVFDKFYLHVIHPISDFILKSNDCNSIAA